MAEIKRMSLNTLLSKSRLFYETSSDESDSEGCQKENSEKNANIKETCIKTEPKTTLEESAGDVREVTNIKEEPEDECSESNESDTTGSNLKEHCKSEPDENSDSTTVKPEPATPIKLEPDLELDVSLDLNSMQMLALKTPIKIEDNVENLPSSQTKITLKSVKRTLSQHRSSPYSKDRSDECRLPAKYRKSNDESSTTMTKRRETDPAILERRQKQIDFGKNTIGYDNYTQLVPKLNRTNDDPTTPNKYKTYSRRAWDGLIKQWRIKLHSYDDCKGGDAWKDT